MSSERFSFPRAELRRRTARGVFVNGAFLVGVESLTLVQGLLVARLLSTKQFALYGIVSITVLSLLALKQVGIDEGYIQQDEEDQELAFQRAFTLDVCLGGLFALLVVVLAPIVAALYGQAELAPLMAALGYLPLAFALMAPAWVFMRRMDFVRQRLLLAIVPIVTFPATIGLVLAGLGAWALVVGAFAGNLVGVLVALRVTPYPLHLRFDRDTLRHYWRFSWPIFAVTGAGLAIRQGQVFAFNAALGLAGASYIALAATFTQYADRADQIVTTTIYPAICAVKDRQAALTRIFVTSNRLTAVWALAFGAGLALFARDLVDHVLGAKWEPAIILLQAMGITTAVHQIGFNWTAFYRAVGNSRPQATFAVVALVTFVAVPLPLLFAVGIDGFAYGMFALMATTGAVRAFYVKALLPELRLGALLARVAVAPVAATLAVLAWRVAAPGPRDLATSLGQLALFLVVYGVVSYAQERPLIRELAGYLSRGAAPAVPESGAAA